MHVTTLIFFFFFKFGQFSGHGPEVVINNRSLAGCLAVRIRADAAGASDLTSVRRLRRTPGSSS